MKNIFALLYFFSATIFAQDYSKEWNKVLVLESDGKIKSASLEVEKIYKKASQSKEEAQLLKCFLYQSKYIQKLLAITKLIGRNRK